MSAWLDRFAEALHERPLSPAEVGSVLNVARDVAHGVERRLAPLASFVAGLYVGRLVAGEGQAREQALAEAVQAARALIPEPS